MVRLHLNPSKALAALFAALHGAMAATLLPVDLSLGVKLGLAALVTASLVQAVWRHALLRGKNAITIVEIRDNQRGAAWSSGQWLEATILGTSYVTPWLTVLNLACEGRRVRHVLIVPDSVAADDFRSARTLLRWKRPEPQANANRRPFV